MDKKNIHLIEADLDMQVWIERYAERKSLSIRESLDRMFRAGRVALEKQEIEIINQARDNLDLSPRAKIGIQASVECLAILRKVHLPDLQDQKQLAREVKELIEKTIKQKQMEDATAC